MDSAPPLGQIGPYRLETFIAAGAMGEVWRARHVGLARPVAIKVITRSFAHEARFRDGLRREVQAMASLRHAGIAVILDYGVIDFESDRFARGSPYYVMEAAAGAPLSAAIAAGLDWAATRDLLLAVLDALAHAHARGVVHRDLKPDNVLDFSPAGDVPRWKLVDFGIAWSSDGQARARAEGLMGTPAYMAPEQFLGRWRDFGAGTDLYALGCIAHEIACGRRPFPGRTVTELAHQHLETGRPAFAPCIDLPDGFDTWLDRMMAKSIGDRFPCAADAAAFLRRLGPARPRPQPSEARPSRAPVSISDSMAATAIERPNASLDETQAGAEEVASSLAATIMPDDDDTRPETLVPPGVAVAITRGAGRFAAPPDVFDFWGEAPTDPRADALAAASVSLFGLRAAPFIGREPERGAAWDALQRIRESGQAEALILEGTAGAGKSRLAEWFCRRVAEIGAAQVLRATHAHHGGAASGLSPMLMRHHQCAGLSAAQIRHRTLWLTRLAHGDDDWDLNVLASLMLEAPGARPSAGRAQGGQDRLGALRKYLQLLGRERPVVVWLDDAHWSEEAVGLTRFVLRWAVQARCPVLFLLTVRTEDLDRVPTMRSALDALAASPRAARIALAPFSSTEMHALIAGRLAVDADLARRIARGSHGNPLYVVQLLGEWVGQGVLSATADGFDVRPGVAPRLPADLHAVWTARVEHLLADRPADERRALQIAAVLGLHVIRTEWAQACVAFGTGAPAPLVAAMVDQGLARWTDEGFAFAHGLLRESLVQSAREVDWPALNACCAAALRAVGVSRRDQARLGRYLYEAGDLQTAIPALLDAVSHAYGHAEIGEAFDLLDLCDTAIEESGAPPAFVAAAWTLRGRICSHLGRREAAEQWLAKAREAAQRAGLTAEYAEALLASALHCRTYHASEEAARLAREALRRFEAVGDRAGCGWARVNLAHVLTNSPEAHTTAAHYSAALADFEALGDHTGMGQCQRGLGWLRQAAGDHAGAATLFALAHDNLIAGGHHLLAMAVVNDIADLHRAAGALDAAEAEYRRVLALFESVGHVNRLVVRLNLGMVELQRERFDAARRLAEQTLEDADDPYLSIAAHAQLLVCAAARRDGAAWRKHFAPVEAGLTDAPEVELDDALTVDQAARIAQRQGDDERTRAAARIGAQLWRRLGRDDRAEAMEILASR